MLHLSVGRLEIDWGKNFAFTDHSPLFQPADVTQVPYYYVDEDDPENEDGEYNLITEYKIGLSKPLSQVLERVNLLGHTLTYARREFEYLSLLNNFDKTKFTFDQLAEGLATVDVQSLSPDHSEGDDFGEFFRNYMFDRLGLAKIVDEPNYARYHAGDCMDNLSAYTIIQLLAQNPSASNLPITWQFADVEHGGWAHREQFVKTLDQANRFLIVTEGSSDAAIIKHAFKLLKPHLSDFFDFVDMKDGYPFSGTGNLFNFTKGLISISVQNNVVIIYDNDAEGVASFNRTAKLNIPANMRVLKLPDLSEFKHFETVGPSGRRKADINGRGAAIECYLDVGRSPVVRWNNYNRDLDVYHGEIVGKGDLAKRFYSISDANDEYDFSKISVVLDMIISECVCMREAALLKAMEAEIEADARNDDDEG
jgi:hypothetical protein